MVMKKIVFGILSSFMALTMVACSAGGQSSSAALSSEPSVAPTSQAASLLPAETEPVTMRIATMKGPTTMGMVKLMSDVDSGNAGGNYQVTMYGTSDEFVPKIVNGEVDIAAVPCNLASVLYQKTGGKIKVAAINTLGVLYMVESGNQVQSVADLKGKTIYTTGKGTTPEYVLRYVLTQNGIDPDQDVTIEFKSESTEVAAMLAQGENVVAMLPQPFVTTAQAKNEKLRIALDMTEEWNKISTDSSLVTGVIIVRDEFLQQNKEAFDTFLQEYKASTEFVNANLDQAAALVGGYEIVPEAVAKKALPHCNITYIDGAEMKQKISGYLNVLAEANPQSVGGKVPDAPFYYEK